MRDLEKKIEKLEQRKNPDNNLLEEIQKYFEEEKIPIIRRIGILAKFGFIDGEEIANLIRKSSEKNNKKGGDE